MLIYPLFDIDNNFASDVLPFFVLEFGFGENFRPSNSLPKLSLRIFYRIHVCILNIELQ
jgi:hypothetical protein